MHFSQSIFLSLLPGQKTREHKGSTAPLLPQHQERRPTPHKVPLHLPGRRGTISFHCGQAKTPALATKRQFLPPFIRYLPKQEGSTTGGSCVGSLTISYLCFNTTIASDFTFQLSIGWRGYYTVNLAVSLWKLSSWNAERCRTRALDAEVLWDFTAWCSVQSLLSLEVLIWPRHFTTWTYSRRNKVNLNIASDNI